MDHQNQEIFYQALMIGDKKLLNYDDLLSYS